MLLIILEWKPITTVLLTMKYVFIKLNKGTNKSKLTVQKYLDKFF